MTNKNPDANNEPSNHDVNNSAPKTFAESNERSSFSQLRLAAHSCKVKLQSGAIPGDRIVDINKLNDTLVQILSYTLQTT